MSRVGLYAGKWTVLLHCNISNIALWTRSHQRWAQMHYTASRINSTSNLWLITSVSHLSQPSPFPVLNNTCLFCFFHYFFISEAPDISNSIPIVLTSSPLQKESRFISNYCIFDLSLISQYSLVPLWFDFTFPSIKFSYFTATFPSIKTSCIYLKTTEK